MKRNCREIECEVFSVALLIKRLLETPRALSFLFTMFVTFTMNTAWAGWATPSYKDSSGNIIRYHCPITEIYAQKRGDESDLFEGGQNFQQKIGKIGAKLSVGDVVEFYSPTLQDMNDKAPGLIPKSVLEEASKRDTTFHWFFHKMVVDPEAEKGLKPLSKKGQRITFQPEEPGVYRLTIQAIRGKDSEGRVLSCEPISRSLYVTMDPSFPNQQLEDSNFSDLKKPFETVRHLKTLKAEAAWQLSPKKGQGVTVAVIDTGINYLSKEFRGKIADYSCKTDEAEKPPCEIPDNNKDDDQNGFVDDVSGWDFHYNDPHPFDDDGHGTFISGLMASHSLGIAPHVKILPIKVPSNSMAVNEEGQIPFVEGIRYAIQRKAQIISYSFTSPLHLTSRVIEKEVEKAIEEAKEAGIVIFTSTGNNRGKQKIGMEEHRGVFTGDEGVLCNRKTGCILGIPASFSNKHSNVIAVAATKWNGDLTDYSQYQKGDYKVLATIGGEIEEEFLYSLPPYNKRGVVSTGSWGTSFSAPLAAAIGALVLSEYPNVFLDSEGKVQFDKLYEVLKTSGKGIVSLGDMVSSGRMLTADSALLRASESRIPPAILKATDAQLNREVSLKILKEGQKAGFERLLKAYEERELMGPLTLYRLGNMFFHAEGTQKDLKKAYELYLEAEDRGSMDALVARASFFRRQKMEYAVELLLTAAKSGHQSAADILDKLKKSGVPIDEKSLESALDSLQRNNLKKRISGLFYSGLKDLKGVKRNPQKALLKFKRAVAFDQCSEHLNSNETFNQCVSSLLRFVDFSPISDELLSSVAVESANQAGVMFLDEKAFPEVTKNIERAEQYLSLSYRNGHITAGFNLAVLYSDKKKEYEKSMSILKSLEENLEDEAARKIAKDILYKIGALYSNGAWDQGKDYEKAKSYLERAIQAGSKKAQSKLQSLQAL